MASVKVLNPSANKIVKIYKEIDHNTKILSTELRKVKISQILPFRVQFTNIQVPGGYGPGNVPPIGIAVIGINNYIL